MAADVINVPLYLINNGEADQPNVRGGGVGGKKRAQVRELSPDRK